MSLNRRSKDAETVSLISDVLRGRFASFLNGVADAVIATVPEMVGNDDGAEDRLRTVIVSHASPLESLLTGVPGTTRPPEGLGGIARTLARRQDPLSVLTRSLEVGHAAMWQALAGALRDRGVAPRQRAEALEVISMRLFEYMQAASAMAVQEYAREEGEVSRQVGARRRDLVQQILRGNGDDKIAEETLGYRFGDIHVAYIVWSSDHDQTRTLGSVVTALRKSVSATQHIDLPWDDRATCGWFTPLNPDWRRELDSYRPPPGTHIAIGSPRRGIEGFRTSRHDADNVRRIADTARLKGIVQYDEVSVVALASQDSWATTAFAEYKLGALVDNSEPTRRLLSTLQAYLSELGSPTHTGRRLGIHRNTVIQRLDRIEQLLGYPAEPADLALRVAVELAVILPRTPRGPGDRT